MTAKTEIVDFLGDMELVLPALLDAAIMFSSSLRL